jgi:hypothetical protein
LKVLKDKSILSTTLWLTESYTGTCVHKLSADGKLVWKTILDAEAINSGPVELDVLDDGSIVCLTNNHFPLGFGVGQLIKLDSNGSLVKHAEFTHKSGIFAGISVVTYKNYIFTTSNDYSYPRRTLIQKFDKDLNQLASVTVNDFYSQDAVKFQDKLLIVGDRDSVLGAALLVFDENLNIKNATQYKIIDSSDLWYSQKIIVDGANPIITGFYFESDSGIMKKFFIYPDDLSASGRLKGNDNQNLTISKNSLYIVGHDSNDAFIANYDLKTRMKNWTNVYGGKEMDDLMHVSVVDNTVYSYGTSYSYNTRFFLGVKIFESYIVTADINGKNACAKSRPIADIHFEDMDVVKYDFPYTTTAIDTPYSLYLNVVSTSDYFDSLACISSSPTNIQHLSTTDIEVYPIVTSGIVHLNHVDVLNGSSYQLVNINGQVMMNGKLKNANNNLDISNLSDGFYLLRVLDEKSKAYSTFKIVKQSN